MTSITLRGRRTRSILWVCAFVSLVLAFGCGGSESKVTVSAEAPGQLKSAQQDMAVDPSGATIPIEPNGPADTVRAFYRLLRERKFRDAMFLTNLKPAIQSLTDDEMKDFSLDFEALAGDVPDKVEINGEIVTGDQATVTVNLPKEQGDDKETQPVKLKRDNGVWMIMTADKDAAAKIKKEGKDYFNNLRVHVHEEEARKMLERISKAQIAHSLQNGGAFTDLPTLVSAGLLPEDAQNDESTGYNYTIDLISGKNQYTATATPAEYGKSGKLSFLLYLDDKGRSHVKDKDTHGKPLR